MRLANMSYDDIIVRNVKTFRGAGMLGDIRAVNVHMIFNGHVKE